jgi:hypothetical protein
MLTASRAEGVWFHPWKTGCHAVVSASRADGVFFPGAENDRRGLLSEREPTAGLQHDNRFSTTTVRPEIHAGSEVTIRAMHLRTKRRDSLILLLFGKSLEIGVTTPGALEQPGWLPESRKPITGPPAKEAP